MHAKFSVMVFTVAAVVALAACGEQKAAAPASPAVPAGKADVVVRIGHVAPMTGRQAHLGKDSENGARLAIAELNARGLEIGGAKVRFELLAEDDQADPKQSVVVARKLVAARVNGVVGHLNSDTTIPASRLYFDAGLPQVSPTATNPEYTQQGFNTAFRVMANDARQGRALGEFAARQGVKRVAIIAARTVYGQGLAEAFRTAVEAAGIEVVANENSSDKAGDFTAILNRIKAQKADLIFYGGMDVQGGPLVRQAKGLGIKALFLGGDGVCTLAYMKLAGPAADGEYCSLPGVPLRRSAKGAAFAHRFAAQFGQGVPLYAPHVYDAVMVIADSMQRAGSVEPAKYLPAIGKTRFEGVSGEIAFDPHGDLKNGAVTIYQYQGGQLNEVETLGGDNPVAAAAAEVREAAQAVAAAAAVVGSEAVKAGAEAVKAGAEAVKEAAEAARAAAEKK